MRDPLPITCPQCNRPVLVFDWAALRDYVGTAQEDGADKPSMLQRIGDKVAKSALKLPARHAGPVLREILTRGEVGAAWCCSACVQSSTQ